MAGVMAMSEHRYWTNESGVVHRVVEWEESSRERFKARIRTACGLEYHTQSAGFGYDPEDLNAAVPAEHRCGNCDWTGDGDD